ncbi:MAG: SRPBCC family protein [Bacteroidales bacterium]|nr:MAG: SRPBCC family protein [Bacteroidales bacterium]
MISLTDSIDIRTTPEKIFAWFSRLPEEYMSWHPDHVSCLVVHGSLPEVGSVIECREYLHGKLHSLRLRITKVIPDKRIDFEVKGMGRGAFEARVAGDTVRFVAELDIGPGTPVIGDLFDLIFSLLFGKRIEAMRKHMAEEGRNLKAILESA